MPKKLDLTNKVFGSLTVLKQAVGTKRVTWVCRCSCGIITNVFSSNLVVGSSRSCGHCKRFPVPLQVPIHEWDKFGWLTVIGEPITHKIDCVCACGNPRTKPYLDIHLESGKAINCGGCKDHNPPIKKLGTKLDLIELVELVKVAEIRGIDCIEHAATGKIIWQNPKFPGPLDAVPGRYRLKLYDIVLILGTGELSVINRIASPSEISVATGQGEFEIYIPSELLLVYRPTEEKK